MQRSRAEQGPESGPSGGLVTAAPRSAAPAHRSAWVGFPVKAERNAAFIYQDRALLRANGQVWGYSLTAG